MLEWFAKWTPEHVIGFVTALGILISAWKFKGKAKTPEAATPTVDVEGLLHNVRLAPSDRAKIDELLDASAHTRRAISSVDGEVVIIKAGVDSIRIALKRIEKAILASSTDEPDTNHS